MIWKSDKLGNVTDVISGSTPNSEVKVFWGGQHVWITPTDLGRLDEIYITSSERKLTDEGLKSASLTLIPANSVVMSSRAPIGHLGIAATELYTNQGCKSFVCKQDLDPHYLYYYLKYCLKEIQSLGSGSTFTEVSKSMLEDFIIFFPKEINDQKKIASKLKKEFSEIQKARKSTEIIKYDITQLKYLTMQNFLSEFEEIEKFALGDKAATTSGSTPSRGQKAYWDPAEIPWIKTGEIAFAPITKSEEYVSSLALKECSLKLLPENSVLIAMYGQGKTRGQSAILKTPATINQACFAILPNDTWEPEFLQLWLMYSYRELRSMSDNRGGNQANLNGDLLNSFKVPAPTKDVQRKVIKKVTAALDEIEKLNGAWKLKFDDIKTLPNRILDMAFN